MSNQFNKIVFVFLMLTASTSFSQYLIKGKLIGGDGLAMKRADIVLVSNREKFPRDILDKYTVNKDGSFEIDIKRKGVHRLWFCGFGHKPFRIPFYLEKPDTTIVNVQLQSNLDMGIKRISLLANYDKKTNKNGFIDTLYLDGINPIKKTYKAYGPKFNYELKETGTRNYFGGSQTEDYPFDCDSTFEEKYNYYYTNVINTVKDSLFKFEFDPSNLIINSAKENYLFIKADYKILDFLKMHNTYEKAMNEYREYAQAIYKKSIDHDAVNKYSFEKYMTYLDERIDKEKNTFMRNCWIVARIANASIDAYGKKDIKISKELGQMALDNIAPDSPLWSYSVAAYSLALSKASGIEKNIKDLKNNHLNLINNINNPYLNYALTALENHPDPSIKTSLYRIVIGNATKFNRQDLVVNYLAKYVEDFPKDISIKSTVDYYSPKRIIKEGNKVPPFEFASIHDTTKIISNMDMLGKKYLIHVWADWCAPCRVEVEAIRNLNNRFAGDNFKVLSVSICFSKENLLKFQETHPMPWFNTHVDMRNDKEGFMKDYEISSIPKDILVDENGTIIATNNLDKIFEILKKNK